MNKKVFLSETILSVFNERIYFASPFTLLLCNLPFFPSDQQSGSLHQQKVKRFPVRRSLECTSSYTTLYRCWKSSEYYKFKQILSMFSFFRIKYQVPHMRFEIYRLSPPQHSLRFHTLVSASLAPYPSRDFLDTIRVILFIEKTLFWVMFWEQLKVKEWTHLCKQGTL